MLICISDLEIFHVLKVVKLSSDAESSPLLDVRTHYIHSEHHTLIYCKHSIEMGLECMAPKCAANFSVFERVLLL